MAVAARFIALYAFLSGCYCWEAAQLRSKDKKSSISTRFQTVLSSNDDLESVCNLASSTNLGYLYPGSWSCSTGPDQLDRQAVCSWHGVSCANGSIISIFLSKSKVVGTIPTSIGNLTALRYLDLGYNSMTSVIPTTIGYLTALTQFRINNNQFVRSIPSTIGYLSALQRLRFSSNLLSDVIPSSIGYLTALIIVTLRNNVLTSSIPTTFGYLTALRFIALRTNSLTGVLPSSFGLLSLLYFIRLSNNALTGLIPASLGRLTNLRYLYLDRNRLQGSIPSLQELTKLIVLGLSHNRLNSSIPSNLGFPSCLSFLDLNHNCLSSIIPLELSRMTQLISLTLDHNNFSSIFPAEVCALPALGYISMGGNQLSCVPWCQDDFDWTATATANALLRCQDGQDRSLWDLEASLGVRLALLSQANLQVSTRIIETTHPCYSYASLVADANAFEYELDVTSFSMGGYLYFCSDSACTQVLGKYGFEGWVRSTASRISSLTIQRSSFYIKFMVDYTVCPLVLAVFICPYSYGFQLTLTSRLQNSVGWTFVPSSPYQSTEHNGSVASPYASAVCQPAWGGVTCNNGLVTGLSLRGLGLHGTLPTSVGMLTGLTSLDLSGNLISGPVLSTLGLLSKLHTLILNQNSFTGSLPRELGNITELYVASFANNRLTGSVPALVESLPALRYLILDGNNFFGEISAQLCKLISATNMTVSLMQNPLLTCYQEQCWSTIQSRWCKFDSSLQMCVPTLSPTADPSNAPTVSPTRLPTVGPTPTFAPSSAPSTAPTAMPSAPTTAPSGFPSVEPTEAPTRSPSSHPTVKPTPTSHPTFSPSASPSTGPSANPTYQPTRAVIIVVPLLNTQQTITLSLCLSLFAALISAYVVYRKFFSSEAYRAQSKRKRLNELPIHRAIVLFKNETEEKLLSYIEENIDTANEVDIDGKTALELILDSKNTFPEAVVYQLLLTSLPFEVESGEVLISDVRGDGWIQAVQSGDDVVCLAVEKVLNDFKKSIKMLATVQDTAGRKCIDLASRRCKEAMYQHLYLHGRFNIQEGPPVHKSATSLVLFAKDYGVGNGFVGASSREERARDGDSQGESAVRTVALKFMRNRDQFEREVEIRRRAKFIVEHVISVLCVFGDVTEEDMKFREDALLKGYEDYPFCVVMEAASLNLKHIIDHEYIANSDWKTIKDMTLDLTKALEHVHSRGIVHGDLKPLNVLRVGMALKLTDLDASVSFEHDEFAGSKFSSGYVCPEMLWMDEDDDEIRVRSARKVHRKNSATSQFLTISTDDGSPIRADPSQDIWALGCVLYYLCTGASLFHVNTEDNIISQQEFLSLFEWDLDTMNDKLSIVADSLVRNLLSLLLSKDPKKRPSAARVLYHPFLTGRASARLPGEEATWDVFLSYRVSSDADNAELIYNALTALGLKVWWDKMCLLPGQNWEEGFCKGLLTSRDFVCLSSKGAIRNPDRDAQNWEKLTEISKCDNVLLEWRLALDLKERGMLNGIFPVMIGDKDAASGQYSRYFLSGCHPSPGDVVVATVETKVREHLAREGLGMPYKESISVKGVLTEVFMSQGGKIEGDITSSVQQVAIAVQKMSQLHSMVANADFRRATSRRHHPVSPMTKEDSDCLKAKTAALEAKLKEREAKIAELLMGQELSNAKKEAKLEEQEAKNMGQETQIADMLAMLMTLQAQNNGQDESEVDVAVKDEAYASDGALSD